MKLTKTKPKSEVEKVKEECKANGLDYDKVIDKAYTDTQGNFKSIFTKNPIILAYLQTMGFNETVDTSHAKDWIDPTDADLNKMIEGQLPVPKLLRPETKKDIMEIINQV